MALGKVDRTHKELVWYLEKRHAILLEEGSMLLDKKNLHRGLQRDFLKASYIDLGKIRVPLSRDFCQISCGIEGSLSKAVL